MKIISTAKRSASAVAIASALSIAGTAPVAAQSNWDFTGFVYLWGATIGGTTTTGQDMSMSFSDILDRLDFGIMGSVEADAGPWTLFADAIYLKLSDGQSAAVGPGIPASADASVKGFVFTSGAGYDIIDDAQSRLNGFWGVRYLGMDVTANITVGNGSQRRTADLKNWDGIIGLRGSQRLSDRWGLAYYADVGTGESELTWQLALTFDYRINNWDLSFGYRHMDWEIDNSQVVSDLSFSGPFIGAKFSF